MSTKSPNRTSNTAIFDAFGYDLTPTLLLRAGGIKARRPALAEFFATTLFVWIGCGTVVSSQSILAFKEFSLQENTFLTAVSLAFGIGITVLIYTIAPISGM
jgi:hypothetical protein